MKNFESFLAPQLLEFIDYRNRLGFALRPLRQNLLIFDRYLTQQKAIRQSLTPAFFLQLRANLKMQPSSINKIVDTARAFFQYLVRKDHYQQNPLKDIPALPENAFIPFIFSSQQIDQLLTAVCKTIRKNPTYFLKDLSTYLAILLMARCGLRISEPLRLMPHHYRTEDKTLYIEKTKFKKDRLIPIPKTVSEHIENYLSVRNALIGNNENPYLFQGMKQKRLNDQRVRTVFHRAVKEIGLNQPKQTIANTTFGSPTPHCLRHCFAVNTLNQVNARGISPQEALPVLATYMGHRHYTYTTKYLKVLRATHRHRLAQFNASRKDKI